ncbi:hypothetical protein [Hymenobacter persicinus]|uniref:Glycosyltransferase RgtA/B/C/D-like domain-containing protein n=1 Tax=Hymenobacter persicinus TaxID=2025506 RepID=A0A4Q5LCL7_9BACT|nr:hypothetical protein [Hymenobacter persicinus]RYU79034.1 hypothetical protein EWM57_11780 [Hymenobacter persicinus]
MKLLVALALNLGLLLALGAWLRRQRRTAELGRWLLPLLGVRLLVSLRDCFLLSGDAVYFQKWARVLTRQLWAAPGSWLRTLLSDELHFGGQSLVYHGYSNTFFLIKLLSALNLASLGAACLNSLYLSLFCFVGCWHLVRSVNAVFPAVPRGAALLALLAWPSAVYWTSGLTKESLLLGSAAGLLALVLPWLYAPGRPRPLAVLGALLLAGLQFKMRFFFAALLFAALGGLALIRVVQQLGGAQSRGVQALLFALVVAGGAWVGSEISPVFRFNKFSSQLLHAYSDMLANSHQQPHIEYADLGPTLPSMLHNAPAALLNVLVRPWPWEGTGLLYGAAGLENMLLLVVVVVAVGAVLRGRGGQLPFALVLALGFYCLALGVLIGLSTPNLGTLNRYRSVLLPFVLLLSLQNEYAARFLRRLGL